MTRRLYVGVTNNIDRRVFEHKKKRTEGFTAKYNIDRLVYVERFDDPAVTIGREKELKGWRREKKIDLINAVNPAWKDLSADWTG